MTRKEMNVAIRPVAFGGPLMKEERQALQRKVDRQVRRSNMTLTEKQARRWQLRHEMGAL